MNIPSELLTAFGGLIALVLTNWYKTKQELKAVKKDNDNRQDEDIKDIKSLLLVSNHQALYDMHQEYCLEKGYMPGFIKETLEKKYAFYHKNGGNGVGTQMYQEMMALPTKPQDKN